jgi:hypothetical protein
MGSSRSRVVARNGGDHRVRLATPITTPSSVPDPLGNRQSEPDRPSHETHPGLRSRRRRGEAADASCNDVRYHSAKGAGERPECAGRSRSREQARVLVAAEAPLPNGGDVARRLSRTPTSGRRTGPTTSCWSSVAPSPREPERAGCACTRTYDGPTRRRRAGHLMCEITNVTARIRLIGHVADPSRAVQPSAAVFSGGR